MVNKVKKDVSTHTPFATNLETFRHLSLLSDVSVTSKPHKCLYIRKKDGKMP